MVSPALLALAEELERQAKALMFGTVIVQFEVEFPIHDGQVRGAEIVRVLPKLRVRPVGPIE